LSAEEGRVRWVEVENATNGYQMVKELSGAGSRKEDVGSCPNSLVKSCSDDNV